MRKYQFNWDLLGNIKEGRPNLGPTIDVDVYRLMQFTLRDALEEAYGTEAADALFYAAGKQAGAAFYQAYLTGPTTLEAFVTLAQQVLREKKIGVLRVEEAEVGTGKITLTIDEDLDCSGLPEMDDEICVYDEGFVSALLEGFTKESWSAKEIDCWCSGGRTCRFLATRQPKT